MSTHNFEVFCDMINTYMRQEKKLTYFWSLRETIRKENIELDNLIHALNQRQPLFSNDLQYIMRRFCPTIYNQEFTEEDFDDTIEITTEHYDHLRLDFAWEHSLNQFILDCMEDSVHPEDVVDQYYNKMPLNFDVVLKVNAINKLDKYYPVKENIISWLNERSQEVSP